MRDATVRLPAARRQLVERMFPDGVPGLWCPSLTHFTDDGGLDVARIRAHLAAMRPWVGGLLVPGSTGEGWELSEAEVRALLAVVLDELAAARSGHLLVGALRTTSREVVRVIRETVGWLCARTGVADPLEALVRARVCGFTVCPPSGEALGQEEIRAGLEEVLGLGLPVALYQLPQVTRNEMSPETVAALAARFPGFWMLKDTSGADRVAAAGVRDVLLVRGAEGGYAGHLAAGGGAYDGFLLSTANCFGRELAEIAARLGRGDRAGAEELSARITAVCEAVFPAAGRVGAGNAFTNANKAMDHWLAHGPRAAEVAPPWLRAGVRLPRELVALAGEALRRAGLGAGRGYLEG